MFQFVIESCIARMDVCSNFKVKSPAEAGLYEKLSFDASSSLDSVDSSVDLMRWEGGIDDSANLPTPKSLL